MATTTTPKMRLITVKIPEVFVEGIDDLVKVGKYASRSEAIRVAIRDFLREMKKFMIVSEREKPRTESRTL